MSDEQLRFRVDHSRVEGYFPDKGDAVIAALTERVTSVNIALMNKIKGKLNGPLLKSHTAKLSNSIRPIPTTSDGQKIAGGVQGGGGGAPYGKFLEDGTQGPYTIAPKDPKQALRFFIGGKEIFAKSVTHPGLKAYRFMKGTLQEEKPNILEQLRETLREQIK